MSRQDVVNDATFYDWGVFQNELGAVGRPAPAIKKERSGRSPDHASDMFLTELKDIFMISSVISRFVRWLGMGECPMSAGVR